ncbi:hypothetical protein CDL15_Pgr024669 [Punica granatum]|uniref:F-box domain-containing protein n=1 Tax=Punica granatum TaxID=22663 RepID=A0A218W402_PUNGR|nr:hypothetical protein CDL15_Pgr024669 [Punica granatum]PKI36448.1 hypothetical protein CRG98_043156 [Punica granatum]
MACPAEEDICLAEEGILIDILSRLPVKSLIRFKCVSKRWHFLISDPRFAMSHLRRSVEQSLNPDSCRRVLIGTKPLRSVNCDALIEDANAHTAITELEYPSMVPEHRFRIVGSCNGLVCLLFYHERLTVWNPSTRQSRDLPSPRPVPFDHMILHGFGYDSVTDDYKVLRGFREKTAGGTYSTAVEIISLQSNSWRRIPDIDYTTTFSQGTYMNGSIHWLYLHRENAPRIVIVSFNLASEEFQEILSLPDTEPLVLFEGIGVMGGCLALYIDSKWEIELWVMKDYGIKSSWTKLFNITREVLPRTFGWWKPVYVTKDWHILFDAGEMDSFSFSVYDPEKSTFKDCGFYADRQNFESETYIESLISPYYQRME